MMVLMIIRGLGILWFVCFSAVFPLYETQWIFCLAKMPSSTPFHNLQSVWHEDCLFVQLWNGLWWAIWIQDTSSQTGFLMDWFCLCDFGYKDFSHVVLKMNDQGGEL